MQYDPIKRSLGKVFNATPALRIIFYRLLDILLLRSWHISHALNQWMSKRNAPASILDAGSGFGQYSYRMAKLSNQNSILGVDVKEEQIADCNNFFSKLGFSKRVRFEKQDLTTFVKPDCFDLILSVDVMEHILEDEQVFSNFNQSLVKGGMLLISTPSDLGGSDSDVHDDSHAHGFIDEHVRDGYNKADIEQKLRKAGFSSIEVKYTYGIPGHISWILSMKVPIMSLNATKLLFILLPFYYVAIFPFCLILNMFDLYLEHKKGTGLMVSAIK